jgi:hypothetical protein
MSENTIIAQRNQWYGIHKHFMKRRNVDIINDSEFKKSHDRFK